MVQTLVCVAACGTCVQAPLGVRILEILCGADIFCMTQVQSRTLVQNVLTINARNVFCAFVSDWAPKMAAAGSGTGRQTRSRHSLASLQQRLPMQFSRTIDHRVGIFHMNESMPSFIFLLRTREKDSSDG